MNNINILFIVLPFMIKNFRFGNSFYTNNMVCKAKISIKFILKYRSKNCVDLK